MSTFPIDAVVEHIRHHHPGCPDFAVAYFSEEITRRDWRDASLGQAVGITMHNFLRHEMTEYETLLLHGMDRKEARLRVQPRIDAMLRLWRKKPRTKKQKRSPEVGNV
ncbi:DUF2293 domain-containing protein [Rhizobium sp. S153]|uniref:DUF2293 domain-containing protein n=1 Tax=Ciceribacter sichuanensis TaxID=2949647 RepID=A0ABT0V6D8_9HYPH|nr:DUF2293 domain-containing protein [Ciceribacter sp. S153]